MHCIKTGCTAYLDPYGEVVHGDLFALEPHEDVITEDSPALILMRISTRDIGGSFSHAFISSIDQWFDEDKPGVSTLVGRMSAFNYDGL